MSDTREPNTVPTTPTELVTLGEGGLRTGPQGLGCMGISDFYGPTDAAEARACLDEAADLGVTLFDTADIYGFGANEEFLAPFLRARRDAVTVATKFGIVRRREDPTFRDSRGDADYVRRSFHASARRLGVDVIDLYYMHRRDTRVPIEETVAAMSELVHEGHVRYLGLSEVTGDELRRAVAVAPIAALQSEWSVLNRDIERSAIPVAAELGVGVVPYSPLGRGFLAGAFRGAEELSTDDGRRGHPQFLGPDGERNSDLVGTALDGVARRHGASRAQIAMAWVHSRSPVHGISVVPIPGTRSRARLHENLAALRITLDADDLRTLDAVAAAVSGDRYADMSSTSTAREPRTG